MWPHDILNQEEAKCPVCAAVLGKRDKNVIYRAHCDECRVTFYWKPRQKKPNAVLDGIKKRLKGFCGPDGCVCRD